MEEREIKIRSFTWLQTEEDPVTGEDIVVNKEARFGEIVELPDHAIARGERLDVFVTEADREQGASEESLELLEMDEEELAEWVSNATIPQVLNAANDDPEMVQMLLDAENTATGGDPRSGLVEGLGRIAGATE